MSGNEIKRAVALTYQVLKDYKPVSTAQGSGLAAEKIIREALESNVPVYKNPDLLKQLTKFDILNDIPEELYPAAEEILDFIFSMDALLGKDSQIKGTQNA